MATINLENAEVLDFSQSANYIDGDIYQYGRTVSLSITAFIYPGNDIESTRFKKIDTTERAHIEEILGQNNSGFVESISINGTIIQNVKILSYEFPTQEASIEDHISLLRVNMSLEFGETFDHTSNLKSTDSEIYKSTDFLLEQYARYFDSFSENFSFAISNDYAHSFTQTLNFELKKDTPTEVDFASIAKEIAIKAFDVTGNAAAKVGYIDSRYAEFIRTVKGNGVFSETYDTINNNFSLSRSISSRSGAYKSTQKDEKWSASLSHALQVDEQGNVSITETGNVQGRTSIALETEALTKKNEDKYENAYTGVKALKSGAYDRCQAILADLVKSSPDWVPGAQEWNNHSDLKTKFVSYGRSINRIAGQINYTISFTTNPRMHNDAIFEYTLDAERGSSNVTTVTENGTITKYDDSKNFLFNAKNLYDKFSSSSDVISRMQPLFDSVKINSSVASLVFPKNLISSSVSFAAYGNSVSYSFAYSDDPALRDETYIRRLEKSSSYEMPVAIRSNLIAPNLKETNYDADQSTIGTKSVSFDCVLKRNPNSNKINSAHTNYLKTASDSIFTSLQSDIQQNAFVKSPQVGKNDLNWYLENLSYNFSSEYDFAYDAEMKFIDKKGVQPTALKY
tara:strand:- start:3163 stop:5040 length:1878 start_codon:yes stop_codon:yes gene_type:complete